MESNDSAEFIYEAETNTKEELLRLEPRQFEAKIKEMAKSAYDHQTEWAVQLTKDQNKLNDEEERLKEVKKELDLKRHEQFVLHGEKENAEKRISDALFLRHR